MNKDTIAIFIYAALESIITAIIIGILIIDYFGNIYAGIIAFIILNGLIFYYTFKNYAEKKDKMALSENSGEL